MTLSVVIPQKCSKFVIRLQVSVLGVASMTANFIEPVFFFYLTNKFEIFPYSLLFNYVIVFRK